MRRLVSPALLALALAGCARPAPLAVTDAWVRLPAVPGRPAAGYFTVRGGPADATVIAVSAPAARRAELHESMAGGMRALGTLAVAAGAQVRLTPGGRHVMLFDVDPRLAAGGTMALRVSFADGRVLETPATLVGPADPAP